MAAAFISLGSNISPEANLREAVKQLRERFGAVQLSPIYQSAAVGFDGPTFLNAVAGIQSALSAEEINDILLCIEDQCQRDRSQPRFSSRTLDLDLLMLDQLIINTARVTLPRPEILQEAFVLKPLADIAGALRHPQTDYTIAELWDRFQASGGNGSTNLSEVEVSL